jgi:hypothetical protein
MKRKRRITTRPGTNQTAVALDKPQTEEEVVSFVSNPRNGFTCGDGSGSCIVSLDYSSQKH